MMNHINITRVPLTAWGRAMEALSDAGLLFMLHITIRAWPLLPESVPRHFDHAGQVTAWGGRGNLVALIVVSFVLYLGLSLAGRYPRIWNFPWEITADNAAMQYRIAGNLLVTSKAIMVCTFAHMLWMAIKSALGHVDGLGAWFLPVSLGLLLLALGVSFYRLFKYR